MTKRPLIAALAVSLMFVSLGAQAFPQGYNLSWDGKRGYSISGMFSYDTSSVGRYVMASDLTGFMIEGWNSGSSLGSWSGTPEYFKFDTSQSKISSLLQAWNVDGGGIGFGCVLTICAMIYDGDPNYDSKKFFSHIEVTPKVIEGGGGQSLSAPTGLLAVLAGLLAFAFRRRVTQ